MIWTEPGHQIDDEAAYIVNSFRRHNRKVYIYGAGTIGAEMYSALKKYGCFAGFIDSDEKKQEQGCWGENVFSFEEILKSRDSAWIVISATPKYQSDIEYNLYKNGLIHKDDYFFYDEMIHYYWPIVALYSYDSCFIPVCQICLTERCTLACEKCAHGCYNVPMNAPDLLWEDFCLTVDLFFGKINYINEFVLIGGEPLLYKRLADAIAYIGERYRDKIGIFSITTNGTIIPDQEALRNSEMFRVLFRISNYTVELPQLKKQYEKLVKTLDGNNIRWKLSRPDLYWLDYGFETVNHSWDEKEMVEFFDSCGTHCREIRQSRLYYCVMARSVSDNLRFDVGKSDYLDIDSLGEDYKKIILEYNLGYSKKGYLDMCRHCNGGETSNTSKIPAARQKVGEAYELFRTSN